MEAGHQDALMRGVFETASDALLVTDGDGVIVLANAQSQAVFGYAADEIVGRPLAPMIPAHDRLITSERVRVTGVHADGTEFPVDVAVSPILVGDTSYVAVAVRDVTARVRSEERTRAMIEAAPDATLIADSDGMIVLTNARVSAVLGYDRGELVGKHLHAVVAHPSAEEITERIASYVLDPQPMPMGYTQEFRARHRDGSEFPIEISIAPLHAGEDTFLSVAVRDVTERVRMQAEGQRLRDELIATVSHELRTPLTSIIGYAELLADLDDADISPKARELLAVIERNAARELRLVDDLLTLAFLDNDGLEIIRAPLDLADVCRRVVEDHGPIAAEAGLELVLVERSMQPVSGDFYRLVQVVENLVTNSVKFTPAGGRIEVHLIDRGSVGVVEVRDNGAGVTPEERAQLFERLYRAPSAIASQKPGAGLGLPIVRAIIEAHDGWVQLESQLGLGTTVRFGIPLAVPES